MPFVSANEKFKKRLFDLNIFNVHVHPKSSMQILNTRTEGHVILLYIVRYTKIIPKML